MEDVADEVPRGDPLECEEPEEIQQPIPFQIGTTPQPDETAGDRLTDWYEEHQPSEARGSTEPPRGFRNHTYILEIKLTHSKYFKFQIKNLHSHLHFSLVFESQSTLGTSKSSFRQEKGT